MIKAILCTVSLHCCASVTNCIKVDDTFLCKYSNTDQNTNFKYLRTSTNTIRHGLILKFYCQTRSCYRRFFMVIFGIPFTAWIKREKKMYRMYVCIWLVGILPWWKKKSSANCSFQCPFHVLTFRINHIESANPMLKRTTFIPSCTPSIFTEWNDFFYCSGCTFFFYRMI